MKSKFPPDRSSVPLFVKACRAAKERNLVDELLDPYRLLVATGKAPADVKAAVSLFKARPFYSAQELAWFWPLISIGLASKERAFKPDAAALHKRLVEFKLPRIRQWDGSFDFVWQGVARHYFVVQDLRRWRNVRITQRQFEEIMSGVDTP